MQVQKVCLGPDRYSHIVIGDDYLPIKPILGFIRYLDNIDKSPHTIRAYANHLKLYWDYLTENKFNWQTVSLDQLSGFVGWLRTSKANDNVISITESLNRKASTINAILGSLSSFYRYHHHLGNTEVTLTEPGNFHGSRYKALLHHAYRNKPTQRRIISMREYKRIPQTITDVQIKQVMEACNNYRDRFLVTLLYETGMRIGEALGLHHEDIISWDNEIHLQPRINNKNDARSKSTQPNIIHVTKELMGLYSNYVNSIHLEISSPYVFLNLNDFTPLRYSSVRKLFKRLSEKLGIKITPHMLRHSHATELMKSGVEPSLIQKRLGHASIQTTIDTYTHIDQETMKQALKTYWAKREEKE